MKHALFLLVTKHVIFMVLCAAILVLGLFGEFFNPALLFRRDLIEQGQLWRIVSGCFVHLGWYHTVMNVFGFAFWYGLFAKTLQVKHWMGLVVLMVLSNGISLYVLSPSIGFYAGLSGSLHGLILYSLVFECRKDKVYWLFLLALVGKVLYEQTPGYDVNYLQEHMNAPVVVDAHFYGAIFGVMLAVGVMAWQKLRRT